MQVFSNFRRCRQDERDVGITALAQRRGHTDAYRIGIAKCAEIGGWSESARLHHFGDDLVRNVQDIRLALLECSNFVAVQIEADYSKAGLRDFHG